ncbi:o-succinylbenzoate--CoA ligase [Microbacterium sp. SSM24]|uniref:o-succinylbenzoate--CoA ligase n=1 Tax=Microbacterium sp. SSM24 TaxID=2991714 RepID=UPI002227D790|nr:o-succinylbenzoate--CoA ligase [Microbacterium sp. SSM24]MCW3492538.1 o-succinylbenzoate--CoA ligase [Microbacterium sp. SSM24]
MQTHGLGSWLPRRRLRNPDKTALIHGDGQQLSYAQLAHTAEQISAILAEHGIRDGDRVAYLGENSPEFLATLFGTVRIGAVFVPINTRLAAPEIRHVLADSGATVLLHDPEFTDRLAPVLETLDVQVVQTGASGRHGASGLSRLLATAREVPAAVETSPQHPAAIVYTSGTTGRAKGAVLTHGNLTAVALNCIVDYDVDSNDVALMISPLFHVASLGMGALPVMLKGATLVLEKGFEAGRALDLIEQHAVTMMSGVPTTYQLIADHPSWSTTDVSTLRRLTCGGSAVPSRIIEAFEARGLAFTQGYGMTETSPGATSLSPAMTRAKAGSVGLPHFFTDVRVAAEDGSPAPTGEIGEIQIWGPNVFAGYHGLPDASAAAFTPDGWFRSGDLGRLDEDGYLYIADRLKDMIISGGENIYPAEVENVLTGLEGVTGAAVIGVPDDRWGEVPIAVVTVRDGVRVDTDTVRAALTDRIARYKIPTRVIVVADLPRTASGKVRKNDLRERYGAG